MPSGEQRQSANRCECPPTAPLPPAPPSAPLRGPFPAYLSPIDGPIPGQNALGNCAVGRLAEEVEIVAEMRVANAMDGEGIRRLRRVLHRTADGHFLQMIRDHLPLITFPVQQTLSSSTFRQPASNSYFCLDLPTKVATSGSNEAESGSTTSSRVDRLRKQKCPSQVDDLRRE